MESTDTLSFGPPMPVGISALERLQQQGFCVLGAAELAAMAGYDLTGCAPAFALWNDLPPDNYLKDGGHYRFRRHASFIHTLHPQGTQAELLAVTQEGRYQRYRANIPLMFDLIGYLTEECCSGHPEKCAPPRKLAISASRGRE